MFREILAYCSLAVGMVSPIPYVIGTIRGGVRPHRITWLLFLLLNINFLISAIVTHGNLWFTVGQLAGPLVIFALSIRYGVGGKSPFDIAALSFAAVAFGLLMMIDDKIFGLILTLLIDMAAGALTVKKVIKDRASESKLTWGLGALSGLLGLISLVNYSVENVLFPLWILLFTTFMFFAAKPPAPGSTPTLCSTPRKQPK
ncbi:MAG: hypothetical protein LBU20_00200 [Candidatus Nomurabacteria bacterium]|jgi:hypothetical protein|nr:hypothetical protein [Candidatus Nomurabacteria bacterium]